MTGDIKEIINTFSNRLKNPFIGTFIIIMAFYYRNAIFIIFGMQQDRIDRINTAISEITWSWYLKGAILSILYILLSKLTMAALEKIALNKLEKTRYENYQEKIREKNKLSNLKETDQIISDLEKKLKASEEKEFSYLKGKYRLLEHSPYSATDLKYFFNMLSKKPISHKDLFHTHEKGLSNLKRMIKDNLVIVGEENYENTYRLNERGLEVQEYLESAYGNLQKDGYSVPNT